MAAPGHQEVMPLYGALELAPQSTLKRFSPLVPAQQCTEYSAEKRVKVFCGASFSGEKRFKGSCGALRYFVARGLVVSALTLVK